MPSNLRRQWLKGWRKRRIARDVSMAQGMVLKMMEEVESVGRSKVVDEYNEMLTAGLGKDEKEMVAKRVWNVEQLTDMEETYIARRTKGLMDVRLVNGERVVTWGKPLRRGEVIFKESTPLFGPRRGRCIACDSPKTHVSCPSCGSWFCSESCQTLSSSLHSLECKLQTSRAFASLQASYAKGNYSLHSSFHSPVHARFLEKNTSPELFKRIVLLMARCISIAQGVKGRFVDPTGLPMISMLPYVPIPTAVDVMPKGKMQPPLELSVLFHLMRSSADVIGTGPASVSTLWSSHRASLWNLWETTLYNHQDASIFPISALLPHSPAPTVTRYHPSSTLCYLVANADMPPGTPLTTSYVPQNLPPKTRAAILHHGWGIHEP